MHSSLQVTEAQSLNGSPIRQSPLYSWVYKLRRTCRSWEGARAAAAGRSWPSPPASKYTGWTLLALTRLTRPAWGGQANPSHRTAVACMHACDCHPAGGTGQQPTRWSPLLLAYSVRVSKAARADMKSRPCKQEGSGGEVRKGSAGCVPGSTQLAPQQASVQHKPPPATSVQTDPSRRRKDRMR